MGGHFFLRCNYSQLHLEISGRPVAFRLRLSNSPDWIWYLSKTDRILGPEISMATRSGIPERTLFLPRKGPHSHNLQKKAHKTKMP